LLLEATVASVTVLTSVYLHILKKTTCDSFQDIWFQNRT